MKKIVVFLIVAALLLCAVSCGNTDNSNAQNNGNSINNDAQNNVSVLNCKNGGKHEYIKGACIGCGVEIFDVIKDYVIKNGTQIGTMSLYTSYGEVQSKDTSIETDWRYYSETDSINIEMSIENYGDTNWVAITFDKYSIEDGEYLWSGGWGYNWSNRGWDGTASMSGNLDPSKFSRSTPRLDYSQVKEHKYKSASSLSSDCAMVIRKNIDDNVISFLSELDYDITLSDLGFTRYQ